MVVDEEKERVGEVVVVEGMEKVGEILVRIIVGRFGRFMYGRLKLMGMERVEKIVKGIEVERV